jgi:dTDP-4-dehydrorhamnose 3,5-epimerase
MRLTETPLAGAFIVELEEHHDERGFFARAFCSEEFAAAGLDARCAQSNICLNTTAGTIRGMHFQLPPRAEAKLVRCIRGSVLDVIVDVRPVSPTFGRHVSVELSSANRTALYVPPMFAHGYQVLEDDTELYYQTSEPYEPGFERGFRYDDPAFSISWSREVALVSIKDLSWADFKSVLEPEVRAMLPVGAR